MPTTLLTKTGNKDVWKIITTAHSVPGLDMRIHISLLLRDDLDYVLLSEHPVLWYYLCNTLQHYTGCQDLRVDVSTGLLA